MSQWSEPETVLVRLDDDEARWLGYASLVPLLVPIDSIEPHPRNPRRGNLDVISRSLADFGQTKPIVVWDETGLIVAGNHTRRAALEKLGWNRIAAVRASMSEQDALAYLLADNRSSDLGTYDDEGLIEILGELTDAGRADATGYTADDLDDLIAAAGKVETTAEEEFRGGYSETEEEIAERQAVRLAGEPMREVVLMFSVADYQQVATWIRMLQREWATEGTIRTVYEALKRSAESL